MEIKSIRELCSLIAFKEGLKKQVSIGNVREIVKVISRFSNSNPEIIPLLIKNGKKKK